MMNAKTLFLSAALVAAPALTFSPSVALAQQAGTTRVAVVNPGKVMDSLKETQALQAKTKAETADLEAQSQTRQQEVADLKARRDQLNATSPQYDQLNRDLLAKAIELQSWTTLNKADLERRQKQQIRTLYEKVEAAVAEIAKQQNIDLVVVQRSAPLPESTDNLPLDQLLGILNAKQVMFANDAADLTGTVIAKLDQQYQSGGK